MELGDFFRTVITPPSAASVSAATSPPGSGSANGTNGATSDGWFCLAVGGNGGGWHEEWYDWPSGLPDILRRVEELRGKVNVYFSSYLFGERSSLKEHVLPTRTIQADLDEADAAALPLVPTILVETSPGRHQAFWVLSEPEAPLDSETHELLSRKLTYAIPNCDRSGWPLGRKVRIPLTFNYKYLDGPKEVKIVGDSLQQYSPAQFELLPEESRAQIEAYESGFLDTQPTLPVGPQELLAKYKDRVGKPYTLYNVKTQDRSATLWALCCALFRAGASRDEVFWIAKSSANNKFVDLKHHGDRELAKDVLRAEHVVRSAKLDPRASIAQARRSGGPPTERRQMMLDITLRSMRETGTFANAYGGNAFYIRRDSGRPIRITRRSDFFEMLLDLQYGLNAVEVDSHFVSMGIYSYVNSLPQSGELAALSHYDAASGFVLLHTGRKEVLQITKDSINKTTDGSYGIVFPWDNEVEPFSPAMRSTNPPLDWAHFLFRETLPGLDALSNIVSTEPEESLALLKVWLLFLIFRDVSGARPILTMIGQPGSGKTTLFKKLYMLLYGRHRALATITDSDDFDHGVSNDPFYAIDNVDTWERWLPDRLAQSAGVSDIRKRKLYTDGDNFTVRRQAMVGITAHNPKFGREDVADRMLIFTFRRLPWFLGDKDMESAVYARRNELWGGIVQDIQRVLRTSYPPAEDVPQFRIADFAKIGLWIARALNIECAFRSGLEKVKESQHNFTLEEEALLTTAIRKMAERTNGSADWRTPGQLWGQLETMADDTSAFVRAYKSSTALGKKLWSMQESLKEEFDIEWKRDPGKAGNLWRIKLRGNQG